MKIRQHRESLDDSMLTLVELDGSQSALQDHVYKTCGEQLKSISLYDAEPDTRIGWPQTYIIMADCGVFGFANCSVNA